MSDRSRKKFFTILELIIAIIILLIITGLLAMTFRVAMKNYNKGMIYSEITHNLTGGFILIKTDIRKIVPIADTENVFFKPQECSFITLAQDDNKQSCLDLVKYKISYDDILRANAQYPDDIRDIDNNFVVILKGLQNPQFEYLYEKTNKKKQKNASGNTIDLTKIDLVDTDSSADSSDSMVNINFPIAIKLDNTIEVDKITKDFSMLFVVPKFVIEKHMSSDTGTDTDIISPQTNKNNY